MKFVLNDTPLPHLLEAFKKVCDLMILLSLIFIIAHEFILGNDYMHACFFRRCFY